MKHFHVKKDTCAIGEAVAQKVDDLGQVWQVQVATTSRVGRPDLTMTLAQEALASARQLLNRCNYD